MSSGGRPEDLFDDRLALAGLADALRERAAPVTAEDIEDMRQEARVALWQAARGYPGSGTSMPFAEYAGIHIRASLREYAERWFADEAFALSADIGEQAGESVFTLWPEA